MAAMGHSFISKIGMRVLGALGTVLILSGCGLGTSPGVTPANAVGSFGILGDLPHLRLDPVPLRPQRFPARIIAHRGFSGRYPENTLSAIRGAVDAGADLIEIDVQLTKDNRLVVMHDDSVDRTTNGKGKVKELTFDELRKLDAGVKFDAQFAGERIPTLEEALQTVKGKAVLNIELKDVEQPGAQTLVVNEVLALLERENYGKHVQVMSFDAGLMKELREKAPRVPMALLAISNPMNVKLKQATAMRMDGLNMYHKAMDRDEIAAIHRAGLHTHGYTVNKSSSMLKLLLAGADGIITNYPDVAAITMGAQFHDDPLPPGLDFAPEEEPLAVR